MAKLPSKRPVSDQIADSLKLQDQSRNEQQKSYFLSEVSRIRCKDAAAKHTANDNLRAECKRVRQIAQELRSKRK